MPVSVKCFLSAIAGAVLTLSISTSWLTSGSSDWGKEQVAKVERGLAMLGADPDDAKFIADKVHVGVACEQTLNLFGLLK
jgi:hypothetical protein